MISTGPNFLKTNKSRLPAAVHIVSQISALASILLVLMIVFGYAFLAIPYADDYGRATTTSIADAYHHVVSNYLNWTGRWVSMAIQFCVWALMAGDTKYFFVGYRLTILVILILNLLGCYYIVRFITNLNQWRAWVLAIGFGGTYLSVFHSPGQTLYWLPGATEGGLSSLIAALVLWGAIPLFSKNATGFIGLRMILVTIGLIFSAGCHELGGMFLASFFCLLSAFAIFSKTEWNVKILISLLILSSIGTAISVFAPGNSVRAYSEGMQTGSLYHAMNAGSQICLRTLRTVLSPSILFGVVILLISAKSHADSLFKVSERASLFIVIGVPIALGSVAATVALKTADIPAGRTINFFVAILIYIWIPALVVWASHIAKSNDRYIPNQMHSWIWIAFTLSLLSGPTLDRGFFSYKTHLPNWLLYQNKKHYVLCNAEKSDRVLVAPPPHRRRCFLLKRISQLTPKH